MNSKIKITETTDTALLTSLNQEVQDLHAIMYPSIFKRFNETTIEMAMRKLVSNPDTKCHLATFGTDICGYMITYIRNYPETAFTFARQSLYIDQIAILEAYRNKGVATELLNFAEKMAIYSNIRRIELDHWTDNTPAAKFFRKKGFTLYREQLMKEV